MRKLLSRNESPSSSNLCRLRTPLPWISTRSQNFADAPLSRKRRRASLGRPRKKQHLLSRKILRRKKTKKTQPTRISRATTHSEA